MQKVRIRRTGSHIYSRVSTLLCRFIGGVTSSKFTWYLSRHPDGRLIKPDPISAALPERRGEGVGRWSGWFFCPSGCCHCSPLDRLWIGSVWRGLGSSIQIYEEGSDMRHFRNRNQRAFVFIWQCARASSSGDLRSRFRGALVTTSHCWCMSED